MKPRALHLLPIFSLDILIQLLSFSFHDFCSQAVLSFLLKHFHSISSSITYAPNSSWGKRQHRLLMNKLSIWFSGQLAQEETVHWSFFCLFLLTCPHECKSLLSSCLYSANHTNFTSWRSQVLVHTSHRHLQLWIFTYLVVYIFVYCNVWIKYL